MTKRLKVVLFYQFLLKVSAEKLTDLKVTFQGQFDVNFYESFHEKGARFSYTEIAKKCHKNELWVEKLEKISLISHQNAKIRLFLGKTYGSIISIQRF